MVIYSVKDGFRALSTWHTRHDGEMAAMLYFSKIKSISRS